MPPDLPSVVGLTALAQCLVVDLASRRTDLPALDECGLAMVRQNRWRAARFGLDASLVDPRTGSKATARDVIKNLVIRLWGVAESLGCARQLGQVWAMADGPGGAERQLAVFERTGDLNAVARYLTGGPARDPRLTHAEPKAAAPAPSPGSFAWPVVPMGGHAARGQAAAG